MFKLNTIISLVLAAILSKLALEKYQIYINNQNSKNIFKQDPYHDHEDIFHRDKRSSFKDPELDDAYCTNKNVQKLKIMESQDNSYEDMVYKEQRMRLQNFCTYEEWKSEEEGYYLIKVAIGFKAKSQVFLELEQMDPNQWPVKLATCQNLHQKNFCTEEFLYSNCLMTAITKIKLNSTLSIRFEDLGLGCDQRFSMNPKYTYIYLIKLNEELI